MQHDGVGEHEIAEIVGPDQPVFEQFVSLLEDFPHLRHIPVTNVGAEHGIEFDAERQSFAPKCDGSHRIIGLAAEIERFDEQVDDIFRLLDVAGRKVVQQI